MEDGRWGRQGRQAKSTGCHKESRRDGELTYETRPETEANPRAGTERDHRIKSPSTSGDVLTEG